VKWILFILILGSFSFLKSERTSVELKIHGVTELKGNLMIAIYKSADKFPKFGKGDINVVHKVQTKISSIHISDLEVGTTYALAVFHDVNENKFLDKNFLGMPEEKYGFSNDARGTFGPPYYREASFTVSNQHKLSVTIR